MTLAEHIRNVCLLVDILTKQNALLNDVITNYKPPKEEKSEADFISLNPTEEQLEFAIESYLLSKGWKRSPEPAGSLPVKELNCSLTSKKWDPPEHILVGHPFNHTLRALAVTFGIAEQAK